MAAATNVDGTVLAGRQGDAAQQIELRPGVLLHQLHRAGTNCWCQAKVGVLALATTRRSRPLRWRAAESGAGAGRPAGALESGWARAAPEQTGCLARR